MARGISAVWGKIPNVIEQRLLVALYEARQPMTHSEILVLAGTLGLMNVSMNLLALNEKGLVTTGKGDRHTLTEAGGALTKVGLVYNLFATPHDLQKPSVNLVKPRGESEPPPVATTPPPATKKPQQPTADNKPPFATRQELLTDVRREQPAVKAPAAPSAAPSRPSDLVSNGSMAVTAAIAVPASAVAPKAPAASPPPPAPVLTTVPPPPVIQQPQPKPAATVSIPKPAAKASPPPMRRPPPPPGARFRR